MYLRRFSRDSIASLSAVRRRSFNVFWELPFFAFAICFSIEGIKPCNVSLEINIISSS
jgi:hypothetical protein